MVGGREGAEESRLDFDFEGSRGYSSLTSPDLDLPHVPTTIVSKPDVLGHVLERKTGREREFTKGTGRSNTQRAHVQKSPAVVKFVYRAMGGPCHRPIARRR